MKNIVILLFAIISSTGLYSQASLLLEEAPAGTFTLKLVFTPDASHTDVLITNLAANIFVPAGASITASSLSGFSFGGGTTFSNSALMNGCGYSGSDDMIRFSSNASVALGDLSGGGSVDVLTYTTATNASSAYNNDNNCINGAIGTNGGTIDPDNVSGSEDPMGVVLSSQTVLPIYISSFDVEKTGQRSANVLWQTSSETNSSHFIVQRSNDTKSWESIGEVAAAGNSSTTIDYSFLDETIPTTLRSGNNVFYYRLVSVDLDESYDISEIRSLSFKPSSTTVSVYPNPTAQHIVVDLTSIEGESTVQILNMEGRLVRQQQVTDEHNGLPVYNLREMGLKRGQYIVRVIESQSGQVHNKKVIYID